MCEAVGREVFRPHSTNVIQLLVDIQSNGISDSTSDYLLNAWSQICKTLSDEFAPYLNLVIPGILKMCQVASDVSISTDPSALIDLQSLMSDERRYKASITTTDLEEKVIAIDTLIEISQSMKNHFEPYIESTKDILLPYVNYTINENIRASAATTLSALVTATKQANSQPERAICLAREFLTHLWTAAGTEYDSHALCSQLDAIKEIIVTLESQFMTQEEINDCGRKIVSFLSSSLKKREKYR